MKKLIFILAFLFVITNIATAQTASFKIKSSATEKLVSTDYTLTNTTVSWFSWDVKRSTPATQDFQVNLDSLTGNHTNVAVSLWGRKFENDSWSQIGSTVNWAGTTSDTTITISNVSINRYRFLKTNFTPTGTGTSTIDSQNLKIWNE